MPKALKRGSSSNESSSRTRDYEVGYGRPPVKNQFKAGNKLGKGRPKGRKNEATIVKEVLQRQITLTENGKPIRKTWEEAMWIQQGRQAVSGDHKATALLSERKRRAEELSIENDELSNEDKEVFDQVLEIILARRMADSKTAGTKK